MSASPKDLQEHFALHAKRFTDDYRAAITNEVKSAVVNDNSIEDVWSVRQQLQEMGVDFVRP